jgi:hypothetical protein
MLTGVKSILESPPHGRAKVVCKRHEGLVESGYKHLIRGWLITPSPKELDPVQRAADRAFTYQTSMEM